MRLSGTGVMKFLRPVVIAALIMAILTPLFAGMAAENLTLRKGVSFVEDKDNGFPIIADKMDDFSTEGGKPTLIFFGASGDLNTNRQAKRLVSIYNKYKNKKLKFLVIDVDHANSQATELIKKHYKGYIPCQVLLDPAGSSVWSKSGEIPEAEVAKVIENKIK